MKRKLTCILILALLLCFSLILPSGAYARISYGADCLATRGELIKSGLRGRDICFTEADFKQALGVSRVSSVTLLSLPEATDGVLKVNGLAAVVGQVVSGDRLSSISFSPASSAIERAEFRFCAGSAVGTTALTCTLRILDRINYAPTVLTAPSSSLYVETRKDVRVFGRMTAEDPEGDLLTYLVISYPTKGALTSDENGEFCYTPNTGASGEDSFRYVARDGYGNYSGVATVRISVRAESSCSTYTDMENDPAHNAALTLTEAGIMNGEIKGDGLYFRPDETVSRAEFVVMAMKAAGIKPAAGVTRTWFDDDGKISAAERPYLATAQLYGYISGYFDGESLCFSPDKDITRAEAAVILNAMLNASVPTSLTTLADASEIPAWASSALYALTGAGIFTAEDGHIHAQDPLTRAAAAETLAATIAYCR